MIVHYSPWLKSLCVWNLFMYEITSHLTPPHTKLYQQNHTKPYHISSLYLQLSITAILIHNATLLSCHFWKIATVSHFRLVLSVSPPLLESFFFCQTRIILFGGSKVFLFEILLSIFPSWTFTKFLHCFWNWSNRTMAMRIFSFNSHLKLLFNFSTFFTMFERF